MNAQVEPVPLLKLNLGCGPSKMEGYINVDSIEFPGIDQVVDLKQPWPWADNSVSDIHLSHVFEHFTALERVHVANEMWRVLVNQGKATVITPHWSSARAYGDFTHQWPPVSEFYLLYLNRAWRKANAPHTDIEHNPQGHNCDFEAQGVHTYEVNRFAGRNNEYVQFALTNYRDAVQDFHATWVAKK